MLRRSFAHNSTMRGNTPLPSCPKSEALRPKPERVGGRPDGIGTHAGRKSGRADGKASCYMLAWTPNLIRIKAHASAWTDAQNARPHGDGRGLRG